MEGGSTKVLSLKKKKKSREPIKHGSTLVPATTALLPQQSCISREVAEVVWLTLGKAQGEVCSRKENWDTACQIFRVYIPLGEIFPSYFHCDTSSLVMCLPGNLPIYGT